MKTSTVKLITRILIAVVGVYLIYVGIMGIVDIFSNFDLTNLLEYTLYILCGFLYIYLAFYFIRGKSHDLYVVIIAVVLILKDSGFNLIIVMNLIIVILIGVLLSKSVVKRKK